LENEKGKRDWQRHRGKKKNRRGRGAWQGNPQRGVTGKKARTRIITARGVTGFWEGRKTTISLKVIKGGGRFCQEGEEV